jgi:hypothetical protein
MKFGTFLEKFCHLLIGPPSPRGFGKNSIVL